MTPNDVAIAAQAEPAEHHKEQRAVGRLVVVAGPSDTGCQVRDRVGLVQVVPKVVQVMLPDPEVRPNKQH